MSLPTVAIIGRPNVGKSTLFNRLTGQRAALVDKTAGVTRDRHYGRASWLGRQFRMIDTGGLLPPQTDRLVQAIREQTEDAIAEAQLLLFVVDIRAGLMAADEEIALQLHKIGKPILLVVNKAENASAFLDATIFYHLGCGDPWWISAEHGTGVGDLLDAILMVLPGESEEAEEKGGIQVAVVGRPNVGKSSLINRILREDRLLVDASPGTTRDAIDSRVRVDNTLYTLIDTAGMRKPRRINEELEKATVAVALRRIQQCQVAVLMLDAVAGIGEQEVRIATYIERQGKACIVVINKWDLIEKVTNTYERFVESVHEAMPFLGHAPIVSVSALTGKRVMKMFPLIQEVYEASTRRIPTSHLQDFLKTVTQKRPAPTYQGKFVKFSFMVQVLITPPTFLCFVNRPQGVTRTYQRYIENQLRQYFDFAGTPIRLQFRKK